MYRRTVSLANPPFANRLRMGARTRCGGRRRVLQKLRKTRLHSLLSSRGIAEARVVETTSGIPLT